MRFTFIGKYLGEILEFSFVSLVKQVVWSEGRFYLLWVPVRQFRFFNSYKIRQVK